MTPEEILGRFQEYAEQMEASAHNISVDAGAAMVAEKITTLSHAAGIKHVIRTIQKELDHD